MTFDWLFEVLRAHPHLIPAAMFVVALAEAVVFTSPIVPATVLFLGLAGLHQAAGGAFVPILIAFIAGTFIGDVVSYVVGRAYRDSIANWWPFAKNPSWLPRSIALMQRWGLLGLIGSKFMGPVRWIGPAVCGILDMRAAHFVAATTVASIATALLLLAPPFYGLKALL